MPYAFEIYTKSDRIIFTLDTTQTLFERPPMTEFKRAGLHKQYETTETSFTKRGMWEQRYAHELSGIALATANGVRVPEVLAASFDESGGTVVYKRHDNLRLDEVLWSRRDDVIIVATGKTLAAIHTINSPEEPSLDLPRRRFSDLQRDILSRSEIPAVIVRDIGDIFEAACQDAINDKTSLIHGDYVLQNVFEANPPIVFDWEHSCNGPTKYDIGGMLSYMILPTLDGGWSLKDYYEACNMALEGYGSTLAIDKDDPLLHIFRLIGHRQVPQYYFMVLEYLAEIGDDPDAQMILSGSRSLEEAEASLLKRGVAMDRLWLQKMVAALSDGSYQVSQAVWNYARSKGVT